MHQPQPKGGETTPLTGEQIAELLEAAGIDVVSLTCCRCQTRPGHAKMLSMMTLVEQSGGAETKVIGRLVDGRWEVTKR